MYSAKLAKSDETCKTGYSPALKHPPTYVQTGQKSEVSPAGGRAKEDTKE